VEELARAYGRKIKCGGEYDIKIEKGEWRDQKILLVRAREMHRLYAESLHNEYTAQHHSKQYDDRQGCKISRHGGSSFDTGLGDPDTDGVASTAFRASVLSPAVDSAIRGARAEPYITLTI